MKVSFFEGSELISEGIEDTIVDKMRGLARMQDELTCLFLADSPFSLAGEWAARRLQMIYPQKKIERVRLMRKEGSSTGATRVRYKDVQMMPVNEDTPISHVWQWVIDQLDYILVYMDSLMCDSREKKSIYNYAARRLGGRCINLCGEDDRHRIHEQILNLPVWQREVMAGKMNRESKNSIAARLGVSKGTLRNYETEARKGLIRQLVPQERVRPKRCAVFDMGALQLSQDEKVALTDVLRYLIEYGYVREFLLSAYINNCEGDLVQSILEAVDASGRKAEIIWVVEDGVQISPVLANQKLLLYKRASNSLKARALEEKKTMIRASDVIICNTDSWYRSGLRYAEEKHIPVINLTQI